MSRFVKELQLKHVSSKLDGVKDLIVVNMVGVDSGKTAAIRRELKQKGFNLLVVKNSLAKQVLAKNELKSTDDLFAGGSAVAWGGANLTELAKLAIEWNKKEPKFELRGACVQGEKFSGKDGVEAVSKLPTREELIGRIVALVQGPGANLASLIQSPARSLASQIKTISEGTASETPAA